MRKRDDKEHPVYMRTLSFDFDYNPSAVCNINWLAVFLF